MKKLRKTRPAIKLKLVPVDKIDVNTCDGCQDLKDMTPIFFQLITEVFGIGDKIEEDDFLLGYHTNGHSMFRRQNVKELEYAK